MLIQIAGSLHSLRKNIKAQTLSEYALVIGIVAAAVFSMQFFIKRRAQAIIYDGVSTLGNPYFKEESSILLPGRKIGSEVMTTTFSQSGIRTLGNKFEDHIEERIVTENRFSSGTINQEEQ